MPPTPLSGARAVRFDDAVAAACIRHLGELIDRIDATRSAAQAGVGDCTAEWRGASRTWFEASHHGSIDLLQRARAAAQALIDAIRRNQIAADARQEQLDHEARRRDLAEVARLQQLAESASR
ncbi:MAG: hypothetical protein KF906_07565 [Actinobacteria bacterium]|nr:hypothetical protein [Actinomycetota bacterium]